MFATTRYSGTPVPAVLPLAAGSRAWIRVESSRTSRSLMPTPRPQEILIHGLTLDGEKFRPSDWAERLCSLFSSFGMNSRMNYSSHVRPACMAGVNCIVVNKELEATDPRSWGFLLAFAKDNHLRVEDLSTTPMPLDD